MRHGNFINLIISSGAIAFVCGFFPGASAANELPNQTKREEQQTTNFNVIGLELVRSTAPVHPIDLDRIKEQRAAGCAESPVRFGYSAVMRGSVDGLQWPKPVRAVLAAAALTSDYEQAGDFISRGLSHPELGTVEKAVLTNQKILTALQFGKRDAARKLLRETPMMLPAGQTIPAPIMSDRLFYQVMVDADSASPKKWRDELDTLLFQALKADPTHFSVRAYRVVSWLVGNMPERKQIGCNRAIKDFSDRVLDVSEASACPLLVAHFEHALNRSLRSTAWEGSNQSRRAWHLLAVAVLANATKANSRADAALQALSKIRSGGRCNALMERELIRIRINP